jgi:hypothetical protein
MRKSIILVFILPLLAFQCNEGIHIMENTEVILIPSTPEIKNDSLEFEIKIKIDQKVIDKCNSMTFYLQLSNDNDKQLIDTFLVQETEFQKYIVKKIATPKTKSYDYLEIKTKCVKKDLTTDFIVISKME